MVYENVKQLCIDHNISIAAMEREAGLTNGTVNGWKRKNPSWGSLEKIAKYFDITISKLVEEKAG